MAYDHEEQQQLDALKAWWKQYGNWVTWSLIIVLALFVAWKAWGIYQVKESTQASVLYTEVQNAIQEKDQAKALRIATDLQQQFSSTVYPQMASMLVAKNAFESNDLKTAKAQLMWVQTHGKTTEFKCLARIRLAGVLLDEKSYDEALKILASDFPAEFASSVADRKGDIFVAQNKLDEARAAYQLALEKGSIRSPDYQYVQLKLDAIGGPASSVITQ